jgi:hypothetical protein
MRYVLAALIVAAFPAFAAGQAAAQSPPAPSIGLPLPPIGLPLPPIGLDTSLDRPVGPITPAPPPSGRGRHFPKPTIVIFGAPYAFGVDPALQSATPGVIAPSVVDEAPPPPSPTGTLRLDVEPAALAQVFVDGEFVGTPADLDGRLELAPGTWRIEIRARGYEAIAFDVRIVEGRTITYRETLNKAGGAGKADALTPTTPTSPTSPTGPTSPTSPTSPRTTFYLIPGCYLGNVHPDLVKLPEGCDLSRMITHTPQ